MAETMNRAAAMNAAMPPPDDPRLDSPVYAALTGPHSRFGQVRRRVVRYQPDVAPFLALPGDASAGDWLDAAHLVPAGTFAATLRTWIEPPPGWQVAREFEVLQMVEDGVEGEAAPQAIPLSAADVPEMLELVAETNPGPFERRTIELGTYLGIRDGGTLVAMAGERFHFDGWREISAVCTAPAGRGRGLATQLVRALVAGIHSRDERAFLTVMATNTNAIRLYEQLGFCIRATRTLAVMARGSG
jgi:ribosomal protein S18 acetylase RimI-like enzyme